MDADLKQGRVATFILGAIIAASTWWLINKLLDKHVAPRLGL